MGGLLLLYQHYSHDRTIGMMQIRKCSEHCNKVDEFIQSSQQVQSITNSIPMMQSIEFHSNQM